MTEKQNNLKKKFKKLKKRHKDLRNKLAGITAQSLPSAKWNVVVPCYNYGKYLSKCVHSILNQSIKDFVITIVNDASTDDTATIAKDLLKHDPRVRYIQNEKNIGLSDTRNIGIKSVISDYVMIIDADDWAEPDMLESAEKMFNEGADVVCPQIMFHYLKSGKTEHFWNNPAVDFSFSSFCKEIKCSSNSSFRRIVWEQVGGYKHTYFEDYDYWLSAIKLNFRFKWLGGRPFIHMLKHDSSRSWLPQQLRDAGHAELAVKYNTRIAGIKPSEEWVKLHTVKISNKKKVCVLVPVLRQGGIERWLLNLVEYCNSLEFTVIVTMRDMPLYQPFVEKLTKLGVSVYTNTIYKGNTAINVDGILSKCKEIIAESDIVLTTHEHLLEEIHSFGKPVLFAVHNDGEWVSNVIKKTMPFVDAFGIVCQAIAKRFPSEFTNYKCIYNGVDINRCLPIRHKSKIKRELGISTSRQSVVFPSRLHYQKYPEVLATASKDLDDKFQALYFAQVETEEEYRYAKIIEKINPNALLFDPVDNIGEIIPIIDILFISSRWEGGPLIALEAWANEIPVVCTDVGLIPELEEKYGDLVYKIKVDDNHLDVQSIQQQIHEATNDTKQIACKCQEVVFNDFGLIRCCKQWEEYIISLI